MKNKSIQQVVFLRLGLVVLMVVVLSLISSSAMLNIQKCNQQVAQEYELLITAIDGKRAHYVWAENLVSSLGVGTEFTGSTDHTTCALGQWLHSDHSHDSSFVQEQVAAMIPVHQEIHAAAKELVSYKDTDLQRAQQTYVKEILPRIQKLSGLLDDMSEVSRQMVVSSQLIAEKATNFSIVIAGLASVIVIILCVWFYLYVKKQVIEPLRIIQEGSRKLRQGDLKFQIDVSAQNEAGALAEDLNDAVAELNRYVQGIDSVMSSYAKGDLTAETNIEFRGDFRQIQNSIEQFCSNMRSTIGQIRSAASDVSNVAQELASSSQQLTTGASEQSDSAEQLKTTLDILFAQVSSNAENTQETSNVVHAISEEMRQSNELIHSLVNAMGEIQQSSSEIGKIIKTIEDIAFQTNILALNAAVEAARAGVAGKGFAVVADEVRNLAGKSAEASQSTADLINRSISSVENGTTIVDHTADALHQVNDHTENVVDHINILTDNFEKQVAELENVTYSLDRINQIIHSNSDTASISAAASQELAGMAEELAGMVSEFNI